MRDSSSVGWHLKVTRDETEVDDVSDYGQTACWNVIESCGFQIRKQGGKRKNFERVTKGKK